MLYFVATIIIFFSISSLAADQVLETVHVRDVLSSDRSNQPELLPMSDATVRTTIISAKEIAVSGATNVTETVMHRPGIDLQTECAICNAKSISLGNLPGRFTTLMLDDIPIYSAVSAPYGLEGTPTNILDRVEVAQGVGASLISPEAMAGSVNMVTKVLTKNEGSIKAEIGENGSQKLDYFQGWTGKEKGQYLAVNGQSHQHDSMDYDGNGVSEFTGYARQLSGIGLGLGYIGGWLTRLRIDQVDEKRGGGAGGVLTSDWNAITSSKTGNPFDWSKGAHASTRSDGWYVPGSSTFSPYDKGMGGLSELIHTRRIQHTLISERTEGKDSYRFAAAYARHRQDSFYEGAIYNARQNQSYLEGRWKHNFQDSALTTGVSYREEDLSSQGVTPAGVAVSNAESYTYQIPGLFTNYNFFAVDSRLEVNASLRQDQHNVYGGMTSPRLQMAYTHNDEWMSRLALGKGFRSPTSFFEQDHGTILDATKIDRTGLKAEEARNISYNLSFDNSESSMTKQTQFTTGISWNEISNMVMLDTTGSSVRMLNAQDPITITSFDATLAQQVLPTWNVRVGLERSWYDFHYQAVTNGVASPFLFARPDWRVFFGADWEKGAWTWRNRATWVGDMDLAKFEAAGNNPQYNFDGTSKLTKSPSFWLLDSRIAYQWDKIWQFYAGVNNLLDFRQSSIESPLYVNSAGEMNVTHIWGPMLGRTVFFGTEIAF